MAVQADATINQLMELYKSPIGFSNYDPFCTQLEHALQTMLRAREQGAAGPAQLQAFLHDVGHLVLNEHADGEDFLTQDLEHEVVGAEYLEMMGFPRTFTEPIRLHVPAKRYLCAVDPAYWAALSDGSRVSLELQGGVMSNEDVDEYQRENGAAGEAAAALRRWEDEGKALFCHGHRDPVALDLSTEGDLRRWMGEVLT
jgi:predicted HD phosphohydrolase